MIRRDDPSAFKTPAIAEREVFRFVRIFPGRENDARAGGIMFFEQPGCATGRRWRFGGGFRSRAEIIPGEGRGYAKHLKRRFDPDLALPAVDRHGNAAIEAGRRHARG